MIKRTSYLLILMALPGLSGVMKAQEINYDSLLQRVDTVENPVYKPVVSFSMGVLNFLGDVTNSAVNPAIGNYAGKVNVSTFVDNAHHFTANFSFMIGRLGGSESSYADVTRNLNFRTSIHAIGASLEYRFGHLFPQNSLVRPYISVGLENINFSAKGDLLDAAGRTYHYWTDGTIRDRAEDAADAIDAGVIRRDYVYETDLRRREQQLGMGDYNQRAFGIPVAAGLHFRIDRRMFFSLGASYHYTWTDYLDNVAFEGTTIQGARGNDSYLFTQLAFHFDLFSDPATRTVDLLYADAEFDPVFFDDEDGDFVLDVTDRCPGTPYGVEVDSLGCPVDTDMDGVPDYQDLEQDTPEGNWVDANGVTLTEEEFAERLRVRDSAMPRENVENYLAMIRSDYRVGPARQIPEAYRPLDTDGDGYLSFEELLRTIDRYFDYQLELTLEELREVNEFFFSQ